MTLQSYCFAPAMSSFILLFPIFVLIFPIFVLCFLTLYFYLCNMKQKTKISVIMPTYNQCSFIRRAISSLIHQTYDGWELVIVDDGSTDGTRQVISDLLADHRIRYFRCDENRGLGHALNRGCRLILRIQYL